MRPQDQTREQWIADGEREDAAIAAAGGLSAYLSKPIKSSLSLVEISIRPDDYRRALELANAIDDRYKGGENYAGEVLGGVERYRVGYVGEFVFERWANQFTDALVMTPGGTTVDGVSHGPDFKLLRQGRPPLTLEVKTQGKVIHKWATILAKQRLEADLFCFVRLDEPQNVARIMGAESRKNVQRWGLRPFPPHDLPARAKLYDELNADADALRAFLIGEKKG